MEGFYYINLDYHNRAPLKPYYICSRCRTHIGFFDNTAPWVEGTWHPSRQGTFQRMQCLNAVVNVVLDGPAGYKFFVITTDFGVPNAELPLRNVAGHWVAVYCIRCNQVLGYKIVVVANNEDSGLVGKYLLDLTQLLLKNPDGSIVPATANY